MSARHFTADDMAGALHALLPPGAAWPRDLGTVQHQVIRGLAAAFSRSAGRAYDLLIDANPATSYELLPQWEQTLGLPGLCGTTAGATMQARQRAAVHALTDQGGQSIDYIVGVAQTLGYSITITEFSRHSVSSTVSAPLTDAGWAHAWQVNGAAYKITAFDVTSTVDAPLANWDSFLLGCVLQRIKPAHTTLIFNFS
jgi:uncharacterized protein YmfQ (DUF2313 family)